MIHERELQVNSEGKDLQRDQSLLHHHVPISAQAAATRPRDHAP